MKKTFYLLSTVLLLNATSEKILGQTLNYDVTLNQYKVITTNNGYIGIGCANSGDWAHITTDKTKFYLNKTIHVNGGISAYYNNDLQLMTNGTPRITAKRYSGNVGIGIQNPTKKLHVNGDALIDGDLFVGSGKHLKFGTQNGNTGSLQIYNADCCYNSYMDYTGGLYFRNQIGGANQGATLGLLGDGSVTIGVWESYDNTYANTSGHKLMVNGSILCEKLKVISNVPDSDHVFEDDYKLLKLDSVKQFIIENKHLPEIPSADEFCEEGYYVGDMDDLLLRKVEELTLYIIELNEKIKELENAKNN